jgi:alpha-L-rhamnosidase
MLHAEVPANTTATIYIPANAASDVLESGQPLALVKEIEVVGKEKEYVVVKVGSGKYAFSTTYKAKQ